jgi:hypothetical protein
MIANMDCQQGALTDRLQMSQSCEGMLQIIIAWLSINTLAVLFLSACRNLHLAYHSQLVTTFSTVCDQFFDK